MSVTFDQIKALTLGQTEGLRDWEGLQVLATFDNANKQANISTSELTFTGPMGQALIDYIDNGASGIGNGIYEGVDFSLSLSNPTTDVFNGFLDLADDIEINRDLRQVKCKLGQVDGLNTFANISQAITVGLLESENKFSASDYVDVPYVKVDDFDFLSTAILIIAAYQMQLEIKKNVKLIADRFNEFGTLATTGLGGPLSAIARTAIYVGITLIYIGFMVIALVKMVKQILDLLLRFRKYHRGIGMKDLITIGCAHAGYTFHSSIPELNEIHYIPKKTEKGRIKIKRGTTGLPLTGGVMYTLSQQVGIVQDLFNAKTKVIGKDVYIEPLKNTAFWEKGSTFEMKDVYIPVEKNNANEIVGTKVISFSTDTADKWTLENYKGTTYEIKTLPKTFDDERKVLIKGLEEITFPVALGTRKDSLTVLEKTLLFFAKIADGMVIVFGGKPQFAAKIKDNLNIMKMSSDLIEVPKLLRLDSSYRLLKTDRDTWGAKYLYDNYHYYNSFVLNNYGQQYQLFKDIRMDASFQNFLDILSNNIGTHSDGRKAEFESILYNFGGGFWNASYRIKKIHSANLKETYTEPE